MSNSRPARKRLKVNPRFVPYEIRFVAMKNASRIRRERATPTVPEGARTDGTSGTSRTPGTPKGTNLRRMHYKIQNGHVLHRPLHSRGTRVRKSGDPDAPADQVYATMTGPQRRRDIHKRNHNSRKATGARNRRRIFRLRRNEERAKRRMLTGR